VPIATCPECRGPGGAREGPRVAALQPRLAGSFLQVCTSAPKTTNTPRTTVTNRSGSANTDGGTPQEEGNERKQEQEGGERSEEVMGLEEKSIQPPHTHTFGQKGFPESCTSQELLAPPAPGGPAIQATCGGSLRRGCRDHAGPPSTPMQRLLWRDVIRGSRGKAGMCLVEPRKGAVRVVVMAAARFTVVVFWGRGGRD